MSEFPRVWIFDSNYRVYEKNANGRSTGGPIWRKHWREITIVGETSRSWVSSLGRKIPKKGGFGISFSEEEIDQAAWVHQNRYPISCAINRLEDYTTLQTVAKAIGYVSKKEKT